MKSKIVKAEKLSPNEYALITEQDHKYYWKTFTPKGNKKWKIMINEGHTILLDWINCQKLEPVAYVGWNCYGQALLEVKLKNIYNIVPEYNTYTSEINPLLDYKDSKWVVDINCPYKNIDTIVVKASEIIV